jgi:hypothetical protein
MIPIADVIDEQSSPSVVIPHQHVGMAVVVDISKRSTTTDF